MIKHCIICGAAFEAPPSSKKITCSAACSAQRKRDAHTGKRNAWSKEARARLSRKRKAEGYSDSARLGLAAAMALPENQRGPQHRGAKRWVLIAPDGTRHEVVNLKDWARKHAEWFDDVADDAERERVANNIRSGFSQVAQSLAGRKKLPCYSYKGWRLGDWPAEK